MAIPQSKGLLLIEIATKLGISKSLVSRLLPSAGNRPDERFDLDHTDDRSGYLGPSHVVFEPANGLDR